ncbi:MAG: hypothetical protein ACREQ2_24605 [Candidatus Binatia bacterium]
MAEEPMIENLRIASKRAGLDLSDDELQRLLPGVLRSKKQAAELRALIAASDEPAARFNVPGASRK